MTRLWEACPPHMQQFLTPEASMRKCHGNPCPRRYHPGIILRIDLLLIIDPLAEGSEAVLPS